MIEPAGLPAVRLAPLRRCARCDKLSDEDMVNFQRVNLLDSTAPNPSVETLLHAFLPHKFIDHTHSTAVLALTDQPDGEAIVREVFGDRVAYVPYTIPGFALAKSVADVFDKNPRRRRPGAAAARHLHRGRHARKQAYDRMIEIRDAWRKSGSADRRKTLVASALAGEARVRAGDRAHPARRRARLSRDELAGTVKRQILDFRTSPAILDLCERRRAAALLRSRAW